MFHGVAIVWAKDATELIFSKSSNIGSCGSRNSVRDILELFHCLLNLNILFTLSNAILVFAYMRTQGSNNIEI